MSRYWSQRNTRNRTHVWNDASASSQPPLVERGPPGPAGRNGLNGIDGVDGAPGADGNADFMLLESIPTSALTSVTSPHYKITGSTDMLADHRCIRSLGTSSHVYNGNHQVQAIALLFKPGIYKFTVCWRHGAVDVHAYGFDTNHNHLIGYMTTNEEPFAPDSYSSVDNNTITRFYVVNNNTNFYYVNRTINTVWNWNHSTIQMCFERIGSVETSGSDDVLAGYLGVPVINTQPIYGGLYWGLGATAPPSGYHPHADPHHPQHAAYVASGGNTNQWATIEIAEENGLALANQAFGWIHRARRFL